MKTNHTPPHRPGHQAPPAPQPTLTGTMFYHANPEELADRIAAKLSGMADAPANLNPEQLALLRLDYLTAKQAAQIIGVTIQTVGVYAKQGLLTRHGRNECYLTSEVLDHAAAKRKTKGNLWKS